MSDGNDSDMRAGRGVFMLQMRALHLQCQFLVENLGFHAVLSLIGDKSVCLHEIKQILGYSTQIR